MQTSEKYEIKKLEWDTKFFGVNSAKVILKAEISTNDINEILEKLKKQKFQFVTIQNVNNNDNNNFFIKDIGRAFLVDINIQFEKKINLNEKDLNCKKIKIQNNMQYNQDILDIAMESFVYSRFINDKNLKNGDKVYYEWTKNSFGNKDKFFCIYQTNVKINGYLLFSIENNEIIIELIAVNKQLKGKGIGSKLIKGVENFAKEKGIKCIKVGTQLNNINAQNFYVGCGFKHITNHSIYHLWL